MSKRYGRQQKRQAKAEIARLRSLVGEESNYKEGAKLSWPDLWTHFNMYKDKVTGKWKVSSSTPEYVTAYLAEKSSYYGFSGGTIAFFCLNTHFAKLVVRHDPVLALELGLINGGDNV